MGVDGASQSDQNGLMDKFGTKLRERAAALGVSNAEVARRSGLTERRYAHYVSGDREPDLATLVKVAEVLQTTPDRLLGVDGAAEAPGPRKLLMDRLVASAEQLSDQDVERFIFQMEAVAAFGSKS